MKQVYGRPSRTLTDIYILNQFVSIFYLQFKKFTSPSIINVVISISLFSINMFLSAWSPSEVYIAVQLELFRVYFRSIARNLLFHMRKWFWISDQFEVLKEKQWLQSNSKRTKCYVWLVCNREVWAPGTTDENSFLIRSLTDAFSIHSQAFNGFESS